MKFRKHISNIPGWRTGRKLIVFESDDWGSIRTRSRYDYDQMLEQGLDLDKSHFTKFDCLESNKDLQRLFNLLTGYNDIYGNHPVFTSMCVVANPDFKKIKDSNYENYFYEPFTETCIKYPNHSNVVNLWKQGIKEGLFIPEFHGREHLNPLRWIRALKSNNRGIKISFEHESLGGTYYYKYKIPQYLAAFDPEFLEDIPHYREILLSGADLFNRLLGYYPRHFVASNKPEPKILEETLNEIGIKYLIRYKIQKYPKGNGEYSTEFNWLGKENKYGQLVLTRNCGFEPSDTSQKDWVDVCLNDIKTAFFWSKPAIISTHRVNYVSGINDNNALSGLNNLKRLLNQILRNWPDVEFITSNQLGEIINKKNNKYVL
jgi:hypothetical protein